MVDYDVGTILQIIDTSKEFHVFPKLGGLYDQDSLFIYIYHKVAEYRSIRADLDSKKVK